MVNLQKEVYMDQPPGFLASCDSRLICKLQRSLYVLKQSPWAWFCLFNFVLIILSSPFITLLASAFTLLFMLMTLSSPSDFETGFRQLKEHLSQQFHIKGLGPLKYFLGIEVAQSTSRIVINQCKYVLDILTEIVVLDCRPWDTPMDPNIKLLPSQGEPLKDPERYRRLVGRLNYLTITKPDITFEVSVVSQFLNAPCDNQSQFLNVVTRIL